MIEMQTSVRFVAPVEARAHVATADPDATSVSSVNALVPPVESLSSMEAVGLMALPLPGRSPDKPPPNAGGGHDRVAEALAQYEGAKQPAETKSRHEEKAAAPNIDPVSLFQGLVTQASRSGGGAGNAFQIYALIQQLATLVEPKVSQPA
jgi:hypothetical protein